MPVTRYETEEAARYLGPKLSPRTLEGWRVRGGGPAYLKVGSRVYYQENDLDSWLQSRRRTSTSDRGSRR